MRIFLIAYFGHKENTKDTMRCSDRKPVYFVYFVTLGVLRDHFVLVTKATKNTRPNGFIRAGTKNTKTCEFSRGIPD